MIDLTTMTLCPICDGQGHWIKENSTRETCNYCRGGGLVSEKDAQDLNRYGKSLRKLNDGEMPF